MNQLAETLLKADTATWSHTFEKLPKYDEKQRRIIYSVEEIVLKDNGYDVKIDHKVDPKDNNHYIFLENLLLQFQFHLHLNSFH